MKMFEFLSEFRLSSIVPKVLVDNKPALFQIMAWHLTGDKPLSEPKMVLFIDAYKSHLASVS